MQRGGSVSYTHSPLFPLSPLLVALCPRCRPLVAALASYRRKFFPVLSSLCSLPSALLSLLFNHLSRHISRHTPRAPADPARANLPVFEALYKSVKDGSETRRSLEFNSRKTYREDLQKELDEIDNQEIWRAGKTVRALRPDANKDEL